MNEKSFMVSTICSAFSIDKVIEQWGWMWEWKFRNFQCLILRAWFQSWRACSSPSSSIYFQLEKIGYSSIKPLLFGIVIWEFKRKSLTISETNTIQVIEKTQPRDFLGRRKRTSFTVIGDCSPGSRVLARRSRGSRSLAIKQSAASRLSSKRSTLGSSPFVIAAAAIIDARGLITPTRNITYSIRPIRENVRSLKKGLVLRAIAILRFTLV